MKFTLLKALRMPLALAFMIHLCGCNRNMAHEGVKGESKSQILPQESILADGTAYNSQLKICFSNESTFSTNSSNVYVCGSVKRPQILKLDSEMTVGSAISKCGGFDKAFAIYIYRHRGETYSVIEISLMADSYKPTGYKWIPVRENDLIIVSQESY